MHSTWKVFGYGCAEQEIPHSILPSANIREWLWTLGYMFEPEPNHADSFSTLAANS